MLLALGLAAFAAVAVVVTTASVVILTRHENAETKKEYASYKLTVDGKVADAKKEGIEAGKTAGNALVRAAELEKEAATTKLEAEKLKSLVSWRIISPEMLSKLKPVLAAKPGAVNIKYTDGDPEAMYTAMQFFKLFNEAHWSIGFGSISFGDGLVFGLAIPDGNWPDIATLRAAFSAADLKFGTALPTSSVVRGSGSTVNGPTLMVGSRAIPMLQ
ncbi:MAG: hypothetical protein QOJ84_5331 [Bradyrhizobium sp.]|nr:hypothetical protein [Bradyrhizobium sp.]